MGNSNEFVLELHYRFLIIFTTKSSLTCFISCILTCKHCTLELLPKDEYLANRIYIRSRKCAHTVESEDPSYRLSPGGRLDIYTDLLLLNQSACYYLKPFLG